MKVMVEKPDFYIGANQTDFTNGTAFKHANNHSGIHGRR